MNKKKNKPKFVFYYANDRLYDDNPYKEYQPSFTYEEYWQDFCDVPIDREKMKSMTAEEIVEEYYYDIDPNTLDEIAPRDMYDSDYLANVQLSSECAYDFFKDIEIPEFILRKMFIGDNPVPGNAFFYVTVEDEETVKKLENHVRGLGYDLTIEIPIDPWSLPHKCPICNKESEEFEWWDKDSGTVCENCCKNALKNKKVKAISLRDNPIFIKGHKCWTFYIKPNVHKTYLDKFDCKTIIEFEERNFNDNYDEIKRYELER